MANNQYDQNRGQKNTSEDSNRSAQNNPGNFKNDPERASEAGRKGGEKSRRS